MRLGFFLILSSMTGSITSLQCWQCELPGNTCYNTSHPGRLTTCPAQITSCFKSQTSSASPVVVRRCGDREADSRCLESTIIQQSQQDSQVSAWVCHCQLEGCNSTVSQALNPLLLLSILSLLTAMSS